MIYVPYDRESVTVDATAGGVSLTSTKYSGDNSARFRYARIQVQVAQIRECIDSTAPVAETTGTIRYVGDEYELWGYEAVSQWRGIRESAQSANLEVTYFGTKNQGG